MINKEESKIVLKEEEISKIGGFQMEEGYIEVICGCTSRKFGDTTGKLKVFESGQFLINCECSVDCKEGKFQLCHNNFETSTIIFWG